MKLRILGLSVERRAALYVFGDALLALLAVAVGHSVRFGGPLANVDLLAILGQYTGAATVFVVANLVCLYIVEAYDVEADFRHRRQVLRLWVAVGVATLLQMAAFYALPFWWWGRGITLLTNASFVVLLTMWRVTQSQVRPRLVLPQHTIIVGAGEPGREIARLIGADMEDRQKYPLLGFVAEPEDVPEATPMRRGPSQGSGAVAVRAAPQRVSVEGLPVLGAPADLRQIVADTGARRVVVAVLSGMQPQLAQQLLECKAAGVVIEDMRTVYKEMTGKVPIFHLSDASIIFGPEFSGVKGVQAALLRVADVIIASIGLLLSAPVIALAGLIVKLETPGPAIFTQERVGLGEAPFTIYKLRTMGVDAEAKSGAVWSQGAADPRVTRVGKLLRRTRIDELPQLYNVLKGDMSMVGPRPEREHFVRQLKEQIPFYGLRFAVKPGVTGWAQVRYRYGASVQDSAEKLCYDLYAVQALSPMLYLVILVKTVQTVLLKPGS